MSNPITTKVNGGATSDLVLDMGTGKVTETSGEVEVTFNKTFSSPPVVYFTTVGTSLSQVWGIKCKENPTTTGFTAVTVVAKQTSDGVSVTAGRGTFQWLAVGT